MTNRAPLKLESASGAAVDLPPQYSRRILLAVTGLSPQIVTRTLYALAREKPAFIPTEIHLITTQEGAERARLALLSDRPGWFNQLLRDYRLPDIQFDANTIMFSWTRRGSRLAISAPVKTTSARRIS